MVVDSWYNGYSPKERDTKFKRFISKKFKEYKYKPNLILYTKKTH